MIDPGCDGLCLRASDVGVPVDGDPVAYPHPDCPAHGDSVEPSLKSATVAAELNSLFGRSDAINTRTCVPRPFGCGRQLTQEEIMDWPAAYRREYSISGTCDTCQDRIFGS